MRTWLAVIAVTACGLLLATGIVVAATPQLGLHAARSSPVAASVTPTYTPAPHTVTASAEPAGVAVVGADSRTSDSLADGQYLVGEDIEAGTYGSEGGYACYWARYADGNTSSETLLDSHIADGPTRVTVHDGELLEFSGCAPFTKAS